MRNPQQFTYYWSQSSIFCFYRGSPNHMGYFFDFHETEESPKKIQKPDMERRECQDRLLNQHQQRLWEGNSLTDFIIYLVQVIGFKYFISWWAAFKWSFFGFCKKWLRWWMEKHKSSLDFCKYNNLPTNLL